MDLTFVMWEIIALILWTSVFTAQGHGISKEDVCKLCDGCMLGSISCQEAGRLNMLPNDLPREIRKVIVVDQRFDSQFLSRQNLSAYSLPGMNIQELTIMGCGLRVIESRTFYGLSRLKKLDVSKNSLSVIKGFTFSGLQLDSLRLDNNEGLTLDAEAFENLTVSSLSIQNCGLQSLSFEVFKPLLLRPGSLTTLRLTSNRLSTLDARFEPFFRGLPFLSLAGNPFTCDCKIMWLSRTLQRKRHSELDDSQAITVSDEDHAVCEMPSRLRARRIVALTPNDFFCEPPQVRALEVDFSDAKGRHLSGNNETVPATIMVKCVVRGSPEMQLAWFRRNGHHGKLQRLQESRTVAPGIAEAQLARSVRSNSFSDEAEVLTCLGVDTYGNTSADLSLHWPPLLVLPKQTIKAGSNEVTSSELIPHVYRSLESDRLDDFLFRKKFTILELIGAVVGTFTSTIFLFLIGYILLYTRHRLKFPKSSSSTAKTVYQPTFSSATTNNKFPDYQVLESNSPTHLEAIANRSCDPRLPANHDWSENTLGGAGTTARGGRYSRRGVDCRTSSGVYSECPTYDMPTNQLPPLPNDPPPSPPPITTTMSHAATLAGIPLGYPPVLPHTFDHLHNQQHHHHQQQQLLAQTLSSNPALLMDMLTLQRGTLQQQQQQPNQEYRL